MKNDYDSLRPIEYLKENFNELIPTVELQTFLNTLENSLRKIKKEISTKKALSSNIKTEIANLKSNLSLIDQELSKLPTSTKDYTNEAQKFIFIGELKSQLEFYQDKWNIEEDLPNTSDLEEQIKELQEIVSDTEEKRRIVIKNLEEVIQKYFNSSNSMGVYCNYKVYLDVKEKSLKLVKPNDIHAQSIIGSKSNYMFLHLFLFLGIHEFFINLKHSYVPKFLILDQPSQPYYEGSKETTDLEEIKIDDDKAKLQDAFKLLNDFITTINDAYKSEFQMILLEHAPEKYWTEINLENFYLVEEFRNGNALIPKRAMKND